MPESYVQTSNFKFAGHWRHDAADSGAEARAIDGIYILPDTISGSAGLDSTRRDHSERQLPRIVSRTMKCI